MLNFLRFKLLQEKQVFIDDLRPKYIMTSLLIRKVITHEESQEILKAGKPAAQVEKLLDILTKKTPEAFQGFISALKRDEDGCEPYPWLAERLEAYFEDDTSHINEKLANGGVPYQINYLLKRETKVTFIRNELKRFVDESRRNENRCWIVLFGPLGSGKSTLAAEIVRDRDLLKDYFSDGIYWIQVGKCSDDEAIKLRIKKLYKFLKLDNEPHPNESIYDMTLFLRQTIAPRPKVLLILDDVWCSKIINAFDIGCPILVTTEHKRSVDDISSHCSCIECPNDLSDVEIKNLFSLHVKCKPEELPDVVDEVCAKCSGSPMIASLIGNIMRDCRDEKKWKNLSIKLDSGIDEAIRRRHTSNDAWAKKKSLCRTAIEESLSEDLKKYFLDFAIFYKDFSVPDKVLELLWEMDSSEVQDTMMELYYRSVVKIENCGDDGYAYGIPNLCYDTLQDMCKEELKERHEVLINNIQKISPSSDGTIDLSLLPDKEYIPFTLGYHLWNAGKYRLLEKQYFDLNFLQQKVRKYDVDDLLQDFRAYRNCFEKEDEVKMFESFIKRYVSKIYYEESDIVQLALFEPRESIVYEKAKDIAQKNGGKYYKWCNKEENTRNIYYYEEKHIHDEVRHAVFNSDSSLIAVVGAKSLIFSSSTYEVVQELIGHSSSVNYCDFNSVGNKIITASSDKTVKIFNIAPSNVNGVQNWKKRASLPSANTFDKEKSEEIKIDKSLFTFTDHKAKVLSCKFSDQDNYIISSDNLGLLYVWEYLRNESKYFGVIKYKIDTLNTCIFCSFSPNLNIFGAAVYDTVKLYKFETGELFRTFKHNSIKIEQFCFTRDEKYVISILDNKVLKWNISTSDKSEISIGRKRNFVILSCCVSDSLFACGTSSGEVIVLNLCSENVVGFLQGHNKEIRNVTFSEDGFKLLSSSSDRFIIHDMATLQDIPLISFEKILSVRETTEDICIALSNYFNCLEVRKGFDSKLISATSSEKSDISACSVSYDFSEVIYGMKDGVIKVYDIATNNSKSLFPSHSNRVNYITHSKTDRTFFTCSEDGTLQIRKQGSEPLILRGHKGSVLMCVQFNTCDKLLSCSKDGTLRVWDTVSGQIDLVIQEGHGNEDVTYCDISPKENLLASASVDGTVKVWDSTNGQLRKTLERKNNEGEKQSEPVRCCRFSPNREILISGYDDGKVFLWSLIGKAEPIEIGSHKSIVYDIQFRADGNQFLTISKTIKLWDLKTEQCQTLVLPSSFMGDMPPSIWTCDNFNVIVTIVNHILYALKKIS